MGWFSQALVLSFLNNDLTIAYFVFFGEEAGLQNVLIIASVGELILYLTSFSNVPGMLSKHVAFLFLSGISIFLTTMIDTCLKIIII